MIDWLRELDEISSESAEFQENTPKTRIPSTDKTGRSHDVSVMSVPNQGISEEKSTETELMARVSDACEGLTIVPVQFVAICNKEDLALIAKGVFSPECLRAYAKSFSEGIKIGRIVFHPKTGELVRHG